MNRVSCLLVLVVGLCATIAPAAPSWAQRSSSVRAEFVKANPCPSTGKTRGACPGWQVDHMHPICAGGIDEVSNLNWIRVEDHKRKTRQDVRECRAQKAAR